MLHVSNAEPTLCFTKVQALAGFVLRMFRVELYHICRPRPAYSWLGAAEDPYVAGVHGLDGNVKSCGCRNICG